VIEVIIGAILIYVFFKTWKLWGVLALLLVGFAWMAL
jgi:hypothetical protein